MTKYFLGLMSGTSLDGLDIAICDFSSPAHIQILSAETVPLPDTLRSRLLRLTEPSSDELVHYGDCDREFAVFCANSVNQCLRNNGLKADQIQAIGSHGQTIRHYPQRPLPFSLQIGCPSTLASLTGIDVIAQFRQKDIALGGQGAPLAPAFHQAFMSSPDEDRAVLNLGGIANLTLLPQAGDVIGFDTGPANCLLDLWYHQHHTGHYDADGNWAAQGQVHTALLDNLYQDPYFSASPPKSTGREYFSASWLATKLQPWSQVPPVDVQRTLLELTAKSIADLCQHYQLPRCFVCGGGVRNSFLQQRLRELAPTTAFQSTTAVAVDPDWVEAATFAWLAYSFLARVPANLPSVTGAQRSAVLGALFPHQ
ncbi:anhydro-N-acetylmuramic acid kinase [Aliidiomarina sp. Khilg15.8]